MRSLSLFFCLLFFFPGTQSNATPSKVIKYVACFVALHTNALCHELGHAIAGRLAFNDPIDIRVGIGGTLNLINKPDIKIKMGLLPILGLSYSKPRVLQSKTEKLKELAAVLAGPLSGSLSSFLLKKIIEKILPITPFTAKLSENFTVLTETSFYDLIPIHLIILTTDGWKAAQLIYSLTNDKPFGY